MALAVLSKFSACLFLPACLSATLGLYWIGARGQENKARIGAGDQEKSAGPPQKARWPCATLAAAVAVLVIWAGYRFSLAPALFDQFAAVARHNTGGHFAWLLGEFRDHGWWYFFLVALTVKTPIAFLLLCIVGYDACFSRSSWKHFRWQPWVPGSGLTILVVCMPVSIDVGIRHILAIYPMLAMVAGFGAVSLFQTRKKAAMALSIGLLVWQILSSALAHPDYLAYFNEIAGKEPERILVDSDLDWGQDLERLSAKLKELGAKEVAWTLFWPIDPAQHGFPAVRPLEPYQPTTGWVAVTAYVMTVRVAAFQSVSGRTDSPFGWLASEQPVARIGKSIKLYYIPPR